MPIISYPTPDIYQMITRPVIVSIVKQIIEGTGINQDIFIEYAGEHTQTPVWRSFISNDPIDVNHSSRMPFYEKIQVETEDNPLEEFILSTPVDYPDNKKIWEDKALGITLSPFYERSEVTINFTYRTPDKGSATRWRNAMRRRFKIKFTDMSMIAHYNVIIPRLLVYFLHNFWKMRENIAGYDQSWDEWFNTNALQKFVTLVMQNGSEPELAMDETQLDILGNFDFTTPPKEDRNEDGSCYTISFSYKFRFDRPNGFILKYPLVIHNQMVPAKLRPANPHRYDPHAVLGNASQSMSRYDVIMQDMGVKRDSLLGGHLVPWFDDWWPKSGYHNLSPLLQLLTRVDADDPTKLIDLEELRSAGLKFSDTTHEYLVREHRYLNRHARSAVHVAVYVNDDLLDSSAYYVTKELVVRLRSTPDMRNVYHVVIFLINDLFGLCSDAYDRLVHFPDAADEILMTLEPTLKDCLPKRLGNKLIPRDEWQKAVCKINTSSKWYGRKHFLVRPTVLGCMIIVDRS